MPTIEERALALVNEVAGFDYLIAGDVMDDDRDYMLKALCRALEAHDATLAEFEAFRRDVSDAVEFDKANYEGLCFPRLSRFILPKPVDPLVEAIREASVSDADDGDASRLRAALAKRGLKLVEVGDAD
jgi:hypothetical protein